MKAGSGIPKTSTTLKISLKKSPPSNLMSNSATSLSIQKFNRYQFLRQTYAHQLQTVNSFSGLLTPHSLNKNPLNSNLTATESTALNTIKVEINFYAVLTIPHGHFLTLLSFSKFTFREVINVKFTAHHCIQMDHCILQAIWAEVVKFGT